MKKLLPFLIVFLAFAPHARAAITDNIVSYWKLDESSGNAADATGNGRTLTNNNSTTYAAAKINNGGVFNGTTQYFGNGSFSGLLASKNATISGWAKFTTVGSVWGFRNDSNCDFYFNPFSSTQAEIRYRNSAGTAITATATGNFDSTFRYYTLTWDGSTITLYQNGVSIGSATGGGGTYFTNTAVTMTLGKNEGSGSFMAGSLDEVGVWSRVLSGTEITQLYNGGTGLQYPFSVSTPANLGTFVLFN